MPTTMIVKPLHLMSDAELLQMREAELEHRRQVALGRGHLRVANESRATAPKDREALQDDRLTAIEAEIERRKGAKKATADTSRQRILAQLFERGERLRAAPDWVEPPAEEQERGRQVIEASLRALQRQIDARNKTGSS